MPDTSLILVIDDSPTIRKLVECHLSEAGHRVALASTADQGVAMAAELKPDLILLDHQLPGTTGDEVCRRLLGNEATARIPVLVSSSLRNRAFTLYSEFPNVIDQIPKPFTPDLLKGGVANALQTGTMIEQAQRTGCAMPESVDEARNPALSGNTAVLNARSVIDFLTNSHVDGRLTLEQGRRRMRFALAGGRVQAVYCSTIAPEELARLLPKEVADLAPLLTVTLSEQQEASMASLVRLLERSLSDPRRLRVLLRAQAAILAYWALTGEPGEFAFEPGVPLPPMFQAFPLQTSLPALVVEGVRRCASPAELARIGPERVARQSPRGANLDRAGLSPQDLRLHTLLDGDEPLEAVASKAGIALTEAASLVIGLELVGQIERRGPVGLPAVLLLDECLENAQLVNRALGPEGAGFSIRHVRDRVAAQLMMRRHTFGLVLLPVDTPDQESFYRGLRQHAPKATRFVGVVRIDDERQIDRLDALESLDGVLHRPITEPDLLATVRQLLTATEPVACT